MASQMRPAPQYFATLALLHEALASLDQMGEGIAAAHLSSVIDILASRVEAPSLLQH